MYRKALLIVVMLLIAVTAFTLVGGAGAAPSPTAKLAGSVPSWATSANFKSSASTTAYVGFRVYLDWRNEAGAEALARAVSDPSSSSYGRYLTPAQFRQQFAPSQSQVLAVQSWLRSNGFAVDYTPANNHYVAAEGTVAQAAAAALSQQAPGLRVAGWWDGSPQPHADADAITRIRLSGAQIALVAYGAPAQEFWIARNMPALPGVVAIGVGGAFDMLAGRVPRAPRWAQSTGLEWLYRLRRQPSRWWRMRALPQFALLAGVAALRRWLTRAEDTGMLTMRGPAHITGAAHARAEPRD